MSQRLKQFVSLLRLTRFALVYTAISNVWLVVFLGHAEDGAITDYTRMAWDLGLTAIIAAGLYLFGMVMNDVLDIRRDKVFAPDKPLPSGQFSATTAMIISMVALMFAIAAAVAMGSLNAATCIICAGFILFYNAAGKFLATIGLVSLGIIRALNMMTADPLLDFIWPVLLTTSHVIGISIIGYILEGKRPKLSGMDIMAVISGWVFCGLLAIGWVAYRWPPDYATLPHIKWTIIIGPALAILSFVVVVAIKMKQCKTRRQAGETLIRLGLIWLIIYDAAWLISAGFWKASLFVLALLPLCMITISTTRQLKQAMETSKAREAEAYKIEPDPDAD